MIIVQKHLVKMILYIMEDLSSVYEAWGEYSINSSFCLRGQIVLHKTIILNTRIPNEQFFSWFVHLSIVSSVYPLVL